ncbi:hypothetical protein Tco_1245519 [Tanacetum coccineum]
MKGECEVLKEREKVRDKECEELKAKCEAAMADFDNNPAVKDLHEKIAALFVEVKEHKASLDRMLLESQNELVTRIGGGCFEGGALCSYGVLEEVANIKETFDILKVKDPHASIETLFSKKPQANPSSTLTSQPLSPPSQVTPMAVLVTMPQSPPTA